MKFFSNGKLLLTGEYLVLNGAKSLAVPLKFGQSLEILDTKENEILSWESYQDKHLWFSARFSVQKQEIIETTDVITAHKLFRILSAAGEIAPGFIANQSGKAAIVNTGFDLLWGFGSSAGLISNIASWAEIDPYELHTRVSTGSGYDVICAGQEGPVFFNKTGEQFEVRKVIFNPPFRSKIFFFYLGNKQDSAESVHHFLNRRKDFRNETAEISNLSERLASASDIDLFEKTLKEHEVILSKVLNQKPLKEFRFPDLKGEIKSLGAWGGDFAMMTWHGTKAELDSYLAEKNISTVFAFDDLIKTW